MRVRLSSDGISAHKRKDIRKLPSPLSFHLMSTQLKAGHLQARKRALTGELSQLAPCAWTFQPLNYGTMRNKSLLFIQYVSFFVSLIWIVKNPSRGSLYPTISYICLRSPELKVFFPLLDIDNVLQYLFQ